MQGDDRLTEVQDFNDIIGNSVQHLLKVVKELEVDEVGSPDMEVEDLRCTIS